MFLANRDMAYTPVTIISGSGKSTNFGLRADRVSKAISSSSTLPIVGRPDKTLYSDWHTICQWVYTYGGYSADNRSQTNLTTLSVYDNNSSQPTDSVTSRGKFYTASTTSLLQSGRSYDPMYCPSTIPSPTTGPMFTTDKTWLWRSSWASAPFSYKFDLTAIGNAVLSYLGYTSLTMSLYAAALVTVESLEEHGNVDVYHDITLFITNYFGTSYVGSYLTTKPNLYASVPTWSAQVQNIPYYGAQYICPVQVFKWSAPSASQRTLYITPGLDAEKYLARYLSIKFWLNAKV